MLETTENKEMQNPLLKKATSFKDISCQGAKFDNIKNTTGARLPSDKQLKEVDPVDGQQSLLDQILSIFRKK